MSSEVPVKIVGVSKTYRIYAQPLDRLKQMLSGGIKNFYEEFEALKGVSFEVNKGEIVGIVGRNGSGKSTLLQIICGIVEPTEGQVAANGRVSALLELGSGFNPEFTGKENIHLNGAILGLSEEEIAARYENIVAFSGLDEAHIRQPIKTYSSGMVVRLAFAVAVAVEPDVLVVDEALAVGDEAFQRKCFARIREIRDNGGTVMFVSHSARTVTELCDRVLLLEGGEALTIGQPKQVMANYHKLIYAPEDKLAEVAKDIKEGKTLEEEEMATSLDSVGFDPALKPESTVVYEAQGAEIISPMLTTKGGDPVNVLEGGKTYRYGFDVAFTAAAKDVRFGMMIKTKSGVELGGASAKLEKIEIVEAGTRYRASFTFKANLLEGTYFLNCGCSAMIDSKRTFLHRITDAAMFKVLPEKDQVKSGPVDFTPKPKIQN